MPQFNYSDTIKILCCMAYFVRCLSLRVAHRLPMKYGDVKEGNWKAKALIKDNEQARSYIVNLNFNLERDEARAWM